MAHLAALCIEPQATGREDDCISVRHCNSLQQRSLPILPKIDLGLQSLWIHQLWNGDNLTSIVWVGRKQEASETQRVANTEFLKKAKLSSQAVKHQSRLMLQTSSCREKEMGVQTLVSKSGAASSAGLRSKTRVISAGCLQIKIPGRSCATSWYEKPVRLWYGGFAAGETGMLYEGSRDSITSDG